MDLRHLDEHSQNNYLDQWTSREAVNQFDIRIPSLVRIFIHVRAPDVFQLTVSFSHLILDGWSQANFLTELLLRYLDKSRHLSLSESMVSPKTPFAKYIESEQKIVKDMSLSDFWNQKITDFLGNRIDLLKRPASTPLPKASQRYLIKPFDISLSSSLLTLAQDQGFPIKTIFLAAHIKLISVILRDHQVMTCIANQNRPKTEDADRLLGLFLNCVPICLDISHVESWLALLEITRDYELDVINFQEYPLAKIQEDLGVNPRHGQFITTLFDIIHFRVFERLEGIENFELMPEFIKQKNNFELVMNVMQDPVTHHISRIYLDYDENKYTKEQAESFYQTYVSILGRMVDDPNGPIIEHS